MAANGAQAAADYASPRLVSLRENLGLLHSQIRQVCVCARGDTLKYGILRGKGAIWRPMGSGYLYSTRFRGFSVPDPNGSAFIAPLIQIQEQ